MAFLIAELLKQERGGKVAADAGRGGTVSCCGSGGPRSTRVTASPLRSVPSRRSARNWSRWRWPCRWRGWSGDTACARVELIAVVVLVLVVELLNTAIEKLADRLTTDHDPQIGRVKDMGSAAVGVALVMAGAFWMFAIAERIGVI